MAGVLIERTYVIEGTDTLREKMMRRDTRRRWTSKSQGERLGQIFLSQGHNPSDTSISNLQPPEVGSDKFLFP